MGLLLLFPLFALEFFRFLAYYLMDWFPIDKYVSIASVSVCCVCIMMSIMQYDNSSLLALGFILLDVTLGLPFPCSSIVIQKFIEPHCSDIRTLSTRSKPSLVPSSAYIEFRSSYFYFTGLLYPIDPKRYFPFWPNSVWDVLSFSMSSFHRQSIPSLTMQRRPIRVSDNRLHESCFASYCRLLPNFSYSPNSCFI